MRVNLFRGAFLFIFLLATLCLGCLHQPKPESIGYVTVLTYNTHLFESTTLGLSNFEEIDRQKEIKDQVMRSGADIVALQEVWRYTRQEQFCNDMKEKKAYSYCWHSKEKAGVLNTSGLVLLSKYKFIGEPVFNEFDRSKFKLIKFDWSKFPWIDPDIEKLSRKGVITATVELRPGARIRLGISQTASGYGVEMADSVKIAEWTTTVKRGDSVSVIDSPAIMMGDFNVHASDSYKTLTNNYKKFDAVDSYREIHPDISENDYTIDWAKNLLFQKFFPKPGGGIAYNRDVIDYVFVKKSGGGLELKPVAAEVIHDWKYYPTTKKYRNQLFDLSDHYPVKVKFEVRRTTTP